MRKFVLFILIYLFMCSYAYASAAEKQFVTIAAEISSGSLENGTECNEKQDKKFFNEDSQDKIKKSDTNIKSTDTETEIEKRRYRELEKLTEITRQGIALYTDNNQDDSLACFLKIPEKMRTAEIWLLIGNILMDKGRKDDAVFMYGRAILTEASYYKAYYNLGNIYLDDDKFNMAIEQYKYAAKYNPVNPYIYYNLGCAYLKSGELKKARYAFIKAIELKNNAADFHYNLAYIYKKLGKEKQAKIYLENYNKLTGQTENTSSKNI